MIGRCMKNIFNSKIFKIFSFLFKTLLFLFLICFIIVVCLQRFSNNKISFFSYRMFNVVSGSMEPKYNVGDVLFSKEVDPSDIKVGDSISYIGVQGQVKNKVITHEVISIEKDLNGKYLFHTKGISSVVEDPVVSEEQIFGVVVYKSAILSFLYKIISTKFGFYILIIVPLFCIIIYEIIMTLLDKKEKNRSI